MLRRIQQSPKKRGGVNQRRQAESQETETVTETETATGTATGIEIEIENEAQTKQKPVSIAARCSWRLQSCQALRALENPRR